MARADSDRLKKTEYFLEASRETPIIAETEVLILGGGPAGMSAAIAAARHGAQTLLVEKYGFLGGTFSAALVCSFCGLHSLQDGEPIQLVHGIVDEFLNRLDYYGGLNKPRVVLNQTASQSFDVAALKIVADEIALKAGVRLLLHSYAVGVIRQENHIVGLIVENKDGRGIIRADTFIDCSGDGDICHFSDVPALDMVEGETTQYPTMIFRVHQVDDHLALSKGKPTFNQLLVEANNSGNWNFPRTTGVLFPQHHQGEWRMNVTQVQLEDGSAPDATDAEQLTWAEIEGRRQVADMFRFLKEKVPGFSNSYLLELPAQVGIRQSRNFMGKYILQEEEVIRGSEVSFPIGISTWPIENHVRGKIAWKLLEKSHYNIPLGCLVLKEIDNLYFAGRCGSFTTGALASVRVSGPCMAMGQAVGTAAALGYKPETVFETKNYSRLKTTLEKDGVTLQDLDRTKKG